MKYSVYLKQGSGTLQTESFLQSSDRLEAVKRDRGQLDRWMAEMGVSVKFHNTAVYTIYEDGRPIYNRTHIGSGSKSWAKEPPPAIVFMRGPDLELARAPLKVEVGDHLVFTGGGSKIRIHSFVLRVSGGRVTLKDARSGLEYTTRVDTGSSNGLRVLFHCTGAEFDTKPVDVWVADITRKASDLTAKSVYSQDNGFVI